MRREKNERQTDRGAQLFFCGRFSFIKKIQKKNDWTNGGFCGSEKTGRQQQRPVVHLDSFCLYVCIYMWKKNMMVFFVSLGLMLASQIHGFSARLVALVADNMSDIVAGDERPSILIIAKWSFEVAKLYASFSINILALFKSLSQFTFTWSSFASIPTQLTDRSHKLKHRIQTKELTSQSRTIWNIHMYVRTLDGRLKIPKPIH